MKLAGFFKTFLPVVIIAVAANAQTWNSNAGGYNGGYGQVYQSFGLAQATMQMQQTTQMQINKLIMQKAMERRWGKAAVARAQQNAARSGSSSSTGSYSGSSSGSSASRTAATPAGRSAAAPKNFAAFKPSPQANNYKLIADTLGTTADEKAYLNSLFIETKKALEAELAKTGRKNNIAAAMTFFIVSNVTVYHGDPEPGDDVTEALFEGINQIFDETPEMASVPNREKQFMYDMMIAFGGLSYAGYLYGKENNDQGTAKAYQKLAGELLKQALKLDAEKIRFVQS